MNRIINFNAGPSVLPPEVLQEASQGILNFKGMGLSILEIGHRTMPFLLVMEEARALVRELLMLDNDHEVLFLHGGATTQFMQVPLNFLKKDETAAYADTGVWSSKAIREAGYVGNVDVVCSSKDENYNYIPKKFDVPQDAKYFHVTSNNTIYGTQWAAIPDVGIPLVADMSSDIFSRAMDFNRFHLIYAGLQKNVGCAGGSMVVVDRNWLAERPMSISPIMDYRNHIAEQSLLNTPPVFAVYVSLLMLRWIKSKGGVAEVEMLNRKKARLLYEEIDRNTLFKGTAKREDRSKMNVTFVMHDKELEREFSNFAKEHNIYGIEGHRTTGGFRASLYNAMPLEDVQILINLMRDFEKAILSK